MRAALDLIPHSGHSSLAAMPPRERARSAAWMPQAPEIVWPVTVETLVMLGRVPHLGAGQRASAADHAAVDEAIAQMALAPLRARAATRLSGGEAARALIARALAQQTPLLMADEPTAGLSKILAQEVYDMLTGLRDEGLTILLVDQEIRHALKIADYVYVLELGRNKYEGPASDFTDLEKAFWVA
jgi:iron complex transport system ATP-binding protein